MKYYFIKLENDLVAPGICMSGNIPAGAVECSQEQYNNSGNYTLENGVIVAYTAPPNQLAIQAASALATARTYIYNNYGILNEDTPEDWVAYIKELMAIANGSDTTSTDLPTAPTTTDAGTSSTTTASTTTATTSTATTTS